MHVYNVVRYLFSEISDGQRFAISRFAAPTSSGKIITLPIHSDVYRDMLVRTYISPDDNSCQY